MTKSSNLPPPSKHPRTTHTEEPAEEWGGDSKLEDDKTVALRDPEVSALKAEVKRLGEIADAEFDVKRAQAAELEKFRHDPAPHAKQVPTPGRIVLVMVLGAKMAPQVRPAIVVRVGDVRVDEGRTTICVHVFYAPEDGPKHDPLLECTEEVAGEGWKVGEWAWPPRA
jgi:hypothetical protein